MLARFTVAFSIPVHEAPDVAVDQICNFLYFAPESCVVIHLSKSFPMSRVDFEALINKTGLFDRSFVNPDSLPTRWGGIVHAHFSNFNYLRTKAEFKYFALHSSNDMLIKHGVERYISSHESGFCTRTVSKDSDWWPAVAASSDSFLLKFAANHLISPIGSQVEGSFYSHEKFAYIYKKYNEYEREIRETPFYTREEFYYPTLAISHGSPTGLPYVFSEVNRFDRSFWWWRRNAIRIIRKFPITKKNKDFLIDNCTLFAKKIIEKLGLYKLTQKDLERFIKSKYGQYNNFATFSDGVSNFNLYDIREIYGIKRVPRKYNHPLRMSLRKLISKDVRL